MISLKYGFIEVEICFVFGSEMCIKTHSKSTLTNYTKTETFSHRLVLVPGEWDKSYLIIKKRLQLRDYETANPKLKWSTFL